MTVALDYIPQPPGFRASACARAIGAERKPLLLVTTSNHALYDHPDPDGRAVHRHLGRLAQPRNHYAAIAETDAAGIPWAADNDCFTRFDPGRYERMLDALQPIAGTYYDRQTGRFIEPRRRSRCLFVTVPDVPGDAVATARRFEAWSSAVRRRGLPVGLVLQDGFEYHERWLSVAFACRVHAVFIGGTTEWKMSPYAGAIARAAKEYGLWVHWGRVNSERRIKHVIATGACDSFDGSGYARWRRRRLDRGLGFTANQARQRQLLAI